MKKLTFISALLAATLISACTTIDVAIAPNADVKKKLKKIAVFPFDVKDAAWGDEFADSITHHFFKTGTIEIVERDAIEKVLKEQGLSMSGAIDQDKAVKIGKLLGADVIILGRGSALRITSSDPVAANLIDTFSLRAVSIETGSLLLTVRKEPGKAWDYRYRLKYCCSLTLIWDSQDVLIQSSRYDDISKQIVKKILEALEELEKNKKLNE